MINKWIPYVFLFTYMIFTLMIYIFKFIGPGSILLRHNGRGESLR